MSKTNWNALFAQAQKARTGFLHRAREGFAYWRNETEVLGRGVPVYEQQRKADCKAPMRFADNRIPHNFHRLLVNQKAGYFASWAPQADTGDEVQNRKLTEFFQHIASEFYQLSTDASNCGEGWLHVWRGVGEGIDCVRVNPMEIYPIWDRSLRRKLLGVFRVYQLGEVSFGEFWDDETVTYLQRDKEGWKAGEKREHGLGCVPFLLFGNNFEQQGDLPQYKELIDLYDKVESGFANDLEDVQQVILILRNYSGMNLSEFMQDIRKYKAVRVDGGADEGGLDKLQIEIPTEARRTLLALLAKEIFVAGQGVNPFDEQVGTTSGVALKFRYSQLELKVMEQERAFVPALRELANLYLRFCKLPCKQEIVFTFTRNNIRSEEELAAIAKESAGLISKRTVLANHPWVEDPEEELARLEEEKDPIPFLG